MCAAKKTPPATQPEVYTYRGGEKIALTKAADQFVVRVKPDQLTPLGFVGAQQVSSASSRVTVDPANLDATMDQLRQIAPTHHAYHLADSDDGSNSDFLITDRVFVTFKAGTSAEAIAILVGKYGLMQREQYDDQRFLLQLTDHTGMNPVKLIVQLTEQEPAVEIAENDINYNIQPQSISLPIDAEYKRQWHLNRQFSDPLYDVRSSSRCEDAWKILDNFGAVEVVVGVTDDGCKLDHPDFDGVSKFAGWGYFTGPRLVTTNDIGANPAAMYEAGNDHGTACCGVVAAEVDAALTVGAAPGCRLLPIKWESIGGGGLAISDSRLMLMLSYVADKVDVLSNSWGGSPRNIWSQIVLDRLKSLALTGGKRGKGILFLWAAGNENCPMSHQTTVDVPYTPGWTYGASGQPTWSSPKTSKTFQNNLVGLPGVMHVAALGSNAQRSHYSNYGTGLAVCAPSSNLHSYYRIPTIRGLGIITTTGGANPVNPSFGGTSSATPLVAGIAALVISANPDLSAIEVISILKSTAAKDLNFTPYPKTPPASYDPNPTWDLSPIAPFDQGQFIDIGSADGTWSPWFGHGNVDAAAAVAAARRRRGVPEPSPIPTPVPTPTPTPEPTPTPISKTVKYESAIAKRIPDNSIRGITAPIDVAAIGQIRSIQVSLDISHAYIGDLQVTLIAPNGDQVLLHDRTGTRRTTIKKTFTSQQVPALAAFIDQEAAGSWRLKVCDRSRLDIGTFNSWGLELEVLETNGAASIEDEDSIVIPDGSMQGILKTVSLPKGTTIRDMSVFVDITHPAIGDLRVSLITPQGIPITLHDQVGGDIDNLIYTWKTQDHVNLRSVRGMDCGGEWQLRVADLSSNNAGKLNRWKIEVVG
jgi:subtilisin-like proprotein convertase family protein/subtilisin family serine protease